MLTRRQFLGFALAAGSGAGLAYGLEAYQQGAPYPQASASVPDAALANTGAPLLLLVGSGASQDMSAYLAEILRAEGLIGFQTARLDTLSAAELSQFTTTLLPANVVRPEQAALIRQYVRQGGNLVAMLPDPSLADLFGVRVLGEGPTRGSLQLVAQAPATAGVDAGPLQFHGPSQRLALAGAQAMAHSAAGEPLVTLHRYGRGQAALWAYNLPRSIALMRQGNPAWADQDRDDIEGVRAADMFVGWVDLERMQVPQADEQQRLLANLLHWLSEAGPPLPRLWYFPAAAPALLVATGDAHGSTVSFIDQVLERVERYGGTMSIYYTPPPAEPLGRLARKARRWAGDLPLVGPALQRDDPLPTPAHVGAWRARGHEFGLHPYVEAGLEQGYNNYWNQFLKHGYGPVPPTVRTHRILWHGWVENARVQARYGLRMNLDHYHVGSAVRKADGTWAAGYLNGSGLPMRFVGEDGRLLSVYQQHTHLVDEHLMNVFDSGHEQGLSGQAAAALSIAQISQCLRRYPAALGLQCHVDPFTLGGAKAEQVGHWFEQTLAYAAAQRLPIFSAERWLAFVEARAQARIDALRWQAQAGRLDLDLVLPDTAPGGLELMLPLLHMQAPLAAIDQGGAPRRWREQQLGDRGYAAVELQAGRQQISAHYRVG
jgi:hypothetical protein